MLDFAGVNNMHRGEPVDMVEQVALLRPRKVRPVDWINPVTNEKTYGVKILFGHYVTWYHVQHNGAALLFPHWVERDRFINDVRRKMESAE